MSSGTCRKCPGDYVPVKGVCDCPAGTIQFPDNSENCAKGNRIVCYGRGTAPFCDGSCEAGEQFKGGGHSSSDQKAGAEYSGGFGSSCSTGSKFLCCRPER